MTPERWQEIERLYHEARERDPSGLASPCRLYALLAEVDLQLIPGAAGTWLL